MKESDIIGLEVKNETKEIKSSPKKKNNDLYMRAGLSKQWSLEWQNDRSNTTKICEQSTHKKQ